MKVYHFNVKTCEMKMDKLKGMKCVSPRSGHSEPCLKSVGHMTKLKNVNKLFKIVRDVNRPKEKCVQCMSMPSG